MKLSNPKISIVMGSQSDWSTLKHTSTVFKELKISHEKKIVSAHRTPKRLYEYAEQAYDKGIKIIIAQINIEPVTFSFFFLLIFKVKTPPIT